MAVQTIHVRQQIPPLERVAMMKPPPEGFPWGSPHNDEYAIKVLGLRGGLVGGLTLISYVAEMLRRFFGPAWLEHGTLDIAFIGGGFINHDRVSGGGTVTQVVPEDNRTRVHAEVWLDNLTTGVKGVVGTASCLV